MSVSVARMSTASVVDQGPTDTVADEVAVRETVSTWHRVLWVVILGYLQVL